MILLIDIIATTLLIALIASILCVLLIASPLIRILKKQPEKPSKLLIIGYTTIDQARNKGIIGDDLNIWYNPGGYFKKVNIHIAAGKRCYSEKLSDKILYTEFSTITILSKLRLMYTAKIAGLGKCIFYSIYAAFISDVLLVNGPNISAICALPAKLITKIPSTVFIEAFWEDVIKYQNFPEIIIKLIPVWYSCVYRLFDAYTGAPYMYPDRYNRLGIDRTKIKKYLNNVDAKRISDYSRKHIAPQIVVNASGPKIITVGRLNEEKLSDEALEAFRLYELRGGPGTLIYVGDGPMREQLTEKVREYDLNGKVIFTGGVSIEIACACMRNSDVFLATYQGNALIEGLACGLPIVAYNNAPHNALVGKCKSVFFVDDRNVEQLADTLFKIIGDNKTLKNYSIQAERWALQVYDRNSIDEATLEPLLWSYKNQFAAE